MLDLLRILDTPDREFTPIPFWFLNGDLDEAEIDRQLRDFHSHGVYGVVLHPRMGLPKRIEYLSETFFRYIRHAVETAAQLGMTVVLYDEGMYPSGSASGLVVRDHPDLRRSTTPITPAKPARRRKRRKALAAPQLVKKSLTDFLTS